MHKLVPLLFILSFSSAQNSNHFIETDNKCSFFTEDTSLIKDYEQGKYSFTWTGECHENRLDGRGTLSRYLIEVGADEKILYSEIEAVFIKGYPRHMKTEYFSELTGRRSRIYHYPGDWSKNPDSLFSTKNFPYADKFIGKLVLKVGDTYWVGRGMNFDRYNDYPPGLKNTSKNDEFWARTRPQFQWHEAWIGNFNYFNTFSPDGFWNYDSVSTECYLIDFPSLENILRKNIQKEFLDGIIPFNEYWAPIAILPFQNNSSNKSLNPLQEGYRDMITTGILNVKSSPYILLEREKIDDIYKELELNQSDYIDEKTAQKMGKGIGAKYILSGNFIDFEDQFRIDTKLTHIESGEIVLSKGINGQVKDFQKIADSTSKLISDYVYSGSKKYYNRIENFSYLYDRKTHVGLTTTLKSFCDVENNPNIQDTVCTYKQLLIARELKNRWKPLNANHAVLETYVWKYFTHAYYVFNQHKKDLSLYTDVADTIMALEPYDRDDDEYDPSKVTQTKANLAYMAISWAAGIHLGYNMGGLSMPKNDKKAKEILDYGLKYFPDDLTLLGYAGENEKIILVLKRKLKEDPKNTDWITQIANSFQILEKYDSAAVYYEKYFTNGGLNNNYQKKDLGLCYFALKKYKDAIKYLNDNNIKEYPPGVSGQTYRTLAHSYVSLDSWKKAEENQIKYMDIWKENFPDQTDDIYNAYISLSEIYLHLDDRKLQKDALDSAFQINENDWLVHNNLGEYYIVTKEYTKAQKAIEEAIELSAELPNAYDTMGDLQLEMGNLDEALNYYFKGIQADSTFAQGLYHIAVVYEKQEHPDFIEYYQKASELGNSEAELWVLKNKRLINDQKSKKSKPAASNNYIDELKKLAELKSLGIITEEEFDAKKKELLGL
tara:strand:+ start:531 stop:3194 length:2664 start_codon:yes stop_codon:yes gene_type:complete